jgi:hypothetical protein
MAKYGNGKIYKIESSAGGKCYVGSTTQRLSERMAKHRHAYKDLKAGNKKRGRSMVCDLFDKHGVDNCIIMLIESFACDTKEELHAREGHYIKTMDCVNKCIPGRRLTGKEYWALKKDTANEKRRRKYAVTKVEYNARRKKLRDAKQRAKTSVESCF